MAKKTFFKKIPGFEPNLKPALTKGQVIEIENPKGVMTATVINNCNSDSDGVCNICMSVDGIRLSKRVNELIQNKTKQSVKTPKFNTTLIDPIINELCEV